MSNPPNPKTDTPIRNPSKNTKNARNSALHQTQTPQFPPETLNQYKPQITKFRSNKISETQHRIARNRNKHQSTKSQKHNSKQKNSRTTTKVQEIFPPQPQTPRNSPKTPNQTIHVKSQSPTQITKSPKSQTNPNQISNQQTQNTHLEKRAGKQNHKEFWRANITNITKIIKTVNTKTKETLNAKHQPKQNITKNKHTNQQTP